MKVYQEITLLPNADIVSNFLLEKVFQQIHLALVEIQDANGKVPVGIAFPEYDIENNLLGNKLRLFATEESSLEKLDIKKWLQKLLDYVHITTLRPVPERVNTYVIYKRQQPKSNVERIARRKSKREIITMEEALDALKNYKEEKVKTPFININSKSSNRRFRLFIIKDKASQTKNTLFTCYGLGQESSVPDF